MIGCDLNEAEILLADILTLSQFEAEGSDIAALCVDVAKSVSSPLFPGGLVPVFDAAGSMHIKVSAPTISTWRRLKPILTAFAGPTITSFDGVPEPFDPGNPISERIMTTKPAVTAIMRLPADRQGRLTALRALRRARETFERAPDLQRAAPVPTSALLARFQDYLNVGRRDAASAILDRLHSEFRLDALNLKFLKVQLHSAFGDWSGIVDLPGFSSLCFARRTPAMTAILLEALYRTHLHQSFEAKDVEETRRRFEKEVRPLAQTMIQTPAPLSLGIGGIRIFGLESLVTESRADLVGILFERKAELGWLADILPAETALKNDQPKELTTLDAARGALVRANEINSNDLLADAAALIARLSPEQIALLRNSVPLRPGLQAIEELAGKNLPTSWVAWLERVCEPSFSTALDVARQGKDEWTIGPWAGDPVSVSAFVNALYRAQENELAAERTAQALPYIVAWLQRDAEFPRSALISVYSELLTLFALGNARGASIYESSLVLIGALLKVSADQKVYRDVIAAIDELAGKGFGVDMVYWILEIVEAFMNASTPDANERENFLHRTLAKIIPVYGRLTRLQALSVSLLAKELNWSLPTDRAAETDAMDQGLAERLKGLRIAIYSLTESSSRQAKTALEEISADVTVDINSDFGGTTRLKALAENADVFVISWLSATHAATDFIRQWRGDRQLVYAQGKGFSSILRAVEEAIGS